MSLIDLHSTFLDYLQVQTSYESDGKSLRRYIENRDDQEEDTYAVSEWSKGTKFDTGPGFNGQGEYEPGFLIRKGDWKLIMPAYERYGLDMLFDLHEDPHELDNLVGHKGFNASDEVIGKAEHLRALLLQYLARTGHPDKHKIENRRLWRPLPFWTGERIIKFRPVLDDGTRTEWLHFGSATQSILSGMEVLLEGRDAKRFELELKMLTQGQRPSGHTAHYVLAITFTDDPNQTYSPTDGSAYLTLHYNVGTIGKSANTTVLLVPPPRKS